MAGRQIEDLAFGKYAQPLLFGLIEK